MKLCLSKCIVKTFRDQADGKASFSPKCYIVSVILLISSIFFQKLTWSGLKSGSMFKRPKANVLLTVVTAKSSIDHIKPQSKASFPVEAVSGISVLSLTDSF